ncbi:hypothetical protein OS493_028491 [Desmophyllum pertusum]|uniref:Uncharacterized protein n=1 Tax=Desmophyllum pertusum TaxID=174260 RepID=A0A9W9Z994_9CNID|nr:hypothetical protein OS493_028491 [Desmophyllum pertusum]
MVKLGPHLSCPSELHLVVLLWQGVELSDGLSAFPGWLHCYLHLEGGQSVVLLSSFMKFSCTSMFWGDAMVMESSILANSANSLELNSGRLSRNGPPKSMATTSHGFFGISVTLIGSCLCCFVVTWGLIALANDLLQPVFLLEHLFGFGHPQVSQVVCCLIDNSSLEACGDDDSVHSENQVIYGI